MAYRNNWSQSSSKDTGWGLIFRLNSIMGKIENDLETGNLEKWNLHIDRIYTNILYKNDSEITYDKNGKIQDVMFSKEDVEVFTNFAQKIKAIKNQIYKTMSVGEEERSGKSLYELKEELYNLLFKKDIWIRKKMFTLKLYLRESESDPRKAIYGG